MDVMIVSDVSGSLWQPQYTVKAQIPVQWIILGREQKLSKFGGVFNESGLRYDYICM